MDRVRRARAFLAEHLGIIAYLILVCALLVNVYRVEAIADESRGALCDLRSDIEHRVENTQRFLDEHPGAFPIPSISRAELQRSLDGQLRTLSALSDLDCG